MTLASAYVRLAASKVAAFSPAFCDRWSRSMLDTAGIEKKEQDATTEEIVSKCDSINGGVVQL